MEKHPSLFAGACLMEKKYVKFFSVIDSHENKLEPLSFTSLTYIKVLCL